MPTPLRRRLRLARRGLVYGAAVALVLLAALLGAASQVLPMVERHPQRIAAWLSERAGRPVAFDRVETGWTRRGPLLRLDNLRIGEGAQAFVIGDTEMLVSLYAGLLPGHPFSELRLRGLDLTLQRGDDGRWQVRGLPGQQKPGGDPLAALEGLGELQVIGGKLHVQAPAFGIDAQVPKIDLRLRVSGDRVRAGVRIWAHLSAAPLDAVLDFDRKRGDGRAYAVARQADLSAWSSLAQIAGVSAEAGRGRAEAWAQLRDHRVAQVTADVAFDGLGLRGRAAAAGATVPRVHFDRVEVRARWQLIDGGWRLDAPRLRIGSGKQPQTLDGLLLAGGRRFALSADRVDAGPLFAVAALSDRIPAGLRHWLQTAQPHASLQQIEVAGERDGPLRAQARIVAFGFASVGNSPGLHGLSGQLRGDGDGFVMRMDPNSPMSFEWPAGFGVTHVVRLTGDVSGWREGDGWRVGTPSLRVQSDTFAVSARGDMWWQGDGSRPWIDLAADIDEMAVPVAKGFWVRHKMPPTVVKWLDDALVAGRLQGGRAIVTGDLDDWPFTDHNGRFEASAHLSGTAVKFQPGWPATDSIEADVSFVGDGFDLHGKGRLLDVDIQQLQAGIDHYKDGDLIVKAQGASDAAQLLTLLKRSPLYATYRDTLDNLTARGAAKVGFDLDLPLRRGEPSKITGNVELRDARLTEARWKLDFQQVNGRADYSRAGFGAESLKVLHEGRPGVLALRAGNDYVRDKNHVFEAGLEASFDADALLDRAAELAWLKPHLAGQSAWTVGVAIPKTQPGTTSPAALLQLHSNLVGTALDLPQPLRKPVGDALATSVEAPLPMGSGDIRVNLGQRLALRARSGENQTGVRVVLGSSRVEEAAPAHGLIATGQAGTLDAIDWIAFMHGGDSGGGLPLQRIDVNAQKLNLLGGAFADTRIIVVPAARGATAVQTEGETLEGALLIPAAEGGTIAGRFDRFHWRADSGTAAAPAGNGAAAATPGSEAEDPFNPAKIPPLAIDFTDLRIADAKLGNAKLRTRPTATGLHVDQLLTRADKQRIDITGDWSGRGSAARTRLDVQIGSQDFGTLLGGLGMSKQLAGGEGTMRFDAGWAGSPAAFNLATLEGNLTADIRNGRLLEVEPGAGRVLGLLSLAQLPRRLMLDFRDFFYKGFAFNQAGGRVDFDGGNARSDQLTIDGPAAAIHIRGSANLRAQSFDQTIEVRPKAGNLLTVAGAIAGGPVGAAIGAAANAVLQKPLGQITSKTYRVTGPWKEPKVEVVGSEQSRAAARPGPPTG